MSLAARAVPFVFLLFTMGSALKSPAGCGSHGECLGANLVSSHSGVDSLAACLDFGEATPGCQAVTYYPGKILGVAESLIIHVLPIP